MYVYIFVDIFNLCNVAAKRGRYPAKEGAWTQNICTFFLGGSIWFQTPPQPQTPLGSMSSLTSSSQIESQSQSLYFNFNLNLNSQSPKSPNPPKAVSVYGELYGASRFSLYNLDRISFGNYNESWMAGIHTCWNARTLLNNQWVYGVVVGLRFTFRGSLPCHLGGITMAPDCRPLVPLTLGTDYSRKLMELLWKVFRKKLLNYYFKICMEGFNNLII